MLFGIVLYGSHNVSLWHAEREFNYVIKWEYSRRFLVIVLCGLLQSKGKGFDVIYDVGVTIIL